MISWSHEPSLFNELITLVPIFLNRVHWEMSPEHFLNGVLKLTELGLWSWKGEGEFQVCSEKRHSPRQHFSLGSSGHQQEGSSTLLSLEVFLNEYLRCLRIHNSPWITGPSTSFVWKFISLMVTWIILRAGAGNLSIIASNPPFLLC